MDQKDVKDDQDAATEAPPSPAEAGAVLPEKEIDELRAHLEAMTAEARANYDRFLRERAELENFRKRMQREKADALRFACEPLIRDLLPVIDNLERAVQCGDGNGKSVVEGVRLVLNSLQEILNRHGVKRVEALGQPFDPTHHQALAQVESIEHEPNRVIEEHHTGYLLHDRLLRPALVTVSTRKRESTVETEQKRD